MPGGGGPKILHVVERSDYALERAIEKALPATIAAYKAVVAPALDKATLAGLVTRYLDSAEFRKLAPRTQRDLRRTFDVVRADLGAMETVALGADKARGALIRWRDRYSDRPKLADDLLGSVARICRWAYDRGEIKANPLLRFPRLYRSNRAEQIWKKSDLIALLKNASPTFRRAVLLASFTGIRLGDLIALSWANVGEAAITYTPSKSKRFGRVATVPITPPVRGLLNLIGRKDVGVVLTNSKGAPWTIWGLQTAMQRQKDAAGIVGLTFHDLRGTAATRFVQKGLPLSDVAMIMGWEEARVQTIARRYVTSEDIGKGLLNRYAGNK